MRLRAGYQISYNLPAPTPMLLTLSVHPTRRGDLETPDWVRTEPPVQVDQYLDTFGNICSRVTAPPGRFVMSADFVVRDSGEADVQAPGAGQLNVQNLPDDVIMFLLGSRYCDTDRLSWIAWNLFGAIEPGWGRVQAICDFTYDRITFGYEHARPTRTAYEAYEERVGVCRDFAHLAVTLCRCMNIPARYCTGYLGDIGVPEAGVMDFSAWFEVYLGGRWHTFDARHNVPRIGRILMAHGRDATDTAISTCFGPNTLVRFDVIAEETSLSPAAPGL